MFTVWITDEGKKVGEKLPEPLLIKNVNDMYVAEFIQGVMYQEWKPDVYNWAQRDASVAKLKKESGEEVRRRKTFSDYKDEGTTTPCHSYWNRQQLQLMLLGARACRVLLTRHQLVRVACESGEVFSCNL
jgi:hypothetical protein